MKQIIEKLSDRRVSLQEIRSNLWELLLNECLLKLMDATTWRRWW